MKKQINKWQMYYVDSLCDGKRPSTPQELMDYTRLGNIEEKVIVHFPKFDSPIKSQNKPAHTETFEVTFDRNDMPNGIINVETLLSNLNLWVGRGYKVEYL